MADIWSDYFADRVTLEPDSGCLLWKQSLTKGYGRGCHPITGPIPAHRLSWILINGKIEKDVCVLHKCDTRNCVNPKHLFIGTRMDNNRDRNAKNRQAFGEKHGSAKLNENQIREVRRRAANGEPQRNIAADYGITVGTVSNIKMRHTWRHAK